MRPTPLIRAADLRRRVRHLGAELAREYSARPPIILALMDGAFCFAADLCRAIPLEGVELQFRRAASYRDGTEPGRLELEPLGDLAGEHVLVVDDIIDSGLTLAAVVAAAHAARAESVATCVLLDKPGRRRPGGLPRADHVGFAIPDLFVVGYGLDHQGRWRHLPDVCVLPDPG